MIGDEALAWLGRQAGGRFSFGLARMHSLLALLGRPDLAIPRIVHVAGTNGKGSVARMVAAMLAVSGCRTGLYTSPPLTTATEACLIDDQPPTGVALAALVAQLAAAATRLQQATGETPTPFERWTALMYLWCAEAGVDVLVQEAGLGGRLDATNAAAATQVAAITNVALDHTDWLGTTPVAIAQEKAGIMRPGMVAVTAATGEALTTVATLAEARHVPLYLVRLDETAAPDPAIPANIAGMFRVSNVTTGIAGTGFTCTGPGLAPLELHCPLPGRHQALNGGLAVATTLLLARRGLAYGGLARGGPSGPITRAALVAGLAQAAWPGRLEVWPTDPPIIFDIAHNPQGMGILVAALREIFPAARPILVCGMLRDKDVPGSVAQWRSWPPSHVVTAAPANHRALSVTAMAEHFKAAGIAAQARDTIPDALRLGLDLSRQQPGGLLCVCGSTYLVGPARAYLTVPDADPSRHHDKES